MAESDKRNRPGDWNLTEFESYEFDYRWTICDISARLCSNDVLSSPSISDPCTEALSWRIELNPRFSLYGQEERHISLHIVPSRKDLFQTQTQKWAKVKFSILNGSKDLKTCDMEDFCNVKYGAAIGFNNVIEKKNLTRMLCKRTYSGGECHNVIPDDTLTVYCKVKVCNFSDPKHKLITTLSPPQFNLGKTMNEARQNEQFTDVVLVIDAREFKAHRVVLASQSPFFKTRFEERWERDDNRITMTDLDPNILEAMLSYMYTGEVENIGTIATTLLPAADEYGIEGLKLVCEDALSKALTATNVIKMIELASRHNAQDLRKACLELVVSNRKQVMLSENWKTLPQSELRTELLETVARSLTS